MEGPTPAELARMWQSFGPQIRRLKAENTEEQLDTRLFFLMQGVPKALSISYTRLETIAKFWEDEKELYDTDRYRNAIFGERVSLAAEVRGIGTEMYASGDYGNESLTVYTIFGWFVVNYPFLFE